MVPTMSNSNTALEMAASSLTSDDDDGPGGCGEINTATVFGNTKTTQHNKLNKCLVKSNLILIVNRRPGFWCLLMARFRPQEWRFWP